MNEVVVQEWARACRALRAARHNLGIDPETAANRAYYAAFHALTALFAARGQSFVRHAGIRAAVHRDLVQTGEWPVNLGRIFDSLMDLRETADYETETDISPPAADKAVQDARRILEHVWASFPGLAPITD